MGGKPTIAGATVNGEVAPLPAVRMTLIDSPESTPFRTFGPAYEIKTSSKARAFQNGWYCDCMLISPSSQAQNLKRLSSLISYLCCSNTTKPNMRVTVPLPSIPPLGIPSLAGTRLRNWWGWGLINRIANSPCDPTVLSNWCLCGFGESSLTLRDAERSRSALRTLERLVCFSFVDDPLSRRMDK